LNVRRADERGHADHGWLDTHHTFSFASYYDPAHMGFRSLRVINDDRVRPGMGFGTHPHQDMEIFSYVLEGTLAHKDSMGNGQQLKPGQIQLMSAGTGITHSEFNPSPTEPVHFYQIWLLPEREGLEPSYEQRAFPEEERQNRLRLAASSDGTDGSLTIRQDARLFLATLDGGREVSHEVPSVRHAWVQVLRGGVSLNGLTLSAGDGAAVSAESHLKIRADGPSEVLLFDLA
jgi:redox-sensitive bicupin YhaK (pirin superfamily)